MGVLVKIPYRPSLRSVEVRDITSGYSNYNRQSFIPMSKIGWLRPSNVLSPLMALASEVLLLDSLMMI